MELSDAFSAYVDLKMVCGSNNNSYNENIN